MIHLDIPGKEQLSLSGAIYTVSFLEDFTATSFVPLLENKSVLLQALETCKIRALVVHSHLGLVVQSIRLDSARRNLSPRVQYFIMLNGIGLELPPTYAPQSNGLAEKLILEH